MSDTTDRLGLTQQKHNENIEHWGEYINANFELIDDDLKELAQELVGDGKGSYTSQLKDSFDSLKERLDDYKIWIETSKEQLYASDVDRRIFCESLTTRTYLGSKFENFNLGTSDLENSSLGGFIFLPHTYSGGGNFYEIANTSTYALKGSLGGKGYSFSRTVYDDVGTSYDGPLFIGYNSSGGSVVGFDITSSPHDIMVVLATHTFNLTAGFDYVDMAAIDGQLQFYNYKLSKTGTSGTFSKGSRVFEYSGIDDDITSSDAFMSGLGKYAPKAGDWFYFKYTHSGDTHEFYAKVVDVGTDYIELDREFTFDSTDSAYTVERWSVLDFKQPNFLVLKTTTDHLDWFFNFINKDNYLLKFYAVQYISLFTSGAKYYLDYVWIPVAFTTGEWLGNEFSSQLAFNSSIIVPARDPSTGNTVFNNGVPDSLEDTLGVSGSLSAGMFPKSVKLIWRVFLHSYSLSTGWSYRWLSGEIFRKKTIVTNVDFATSSVNSEALYTSLYRVDFSAIITTSGVDIKVSANKNTDATSLSLAELYIGNSVLHNSAHDDVWFYPYFVIEY